MFAPPAASKPTTSAYVPPAPLQQQPSQSLLGHQIVPRLSKIALPDLVAFAAVDAVRTMCCMASAPPDLFYRACQLIHVLLRRPSVARDELLQSSDVARDDLLCCAAGALFATAKAMSFLNLMATNDLINCMHRCMWRRKSRNVLGAVCNMGGDVSELSAFNRTNLTQRVVRWEYVLLEASGFKVISPTPFAFAINLTRLVHAALEGAVAAESQLLHRKKGGKGDAPLIPAASYPRLLTAVIACCNDAARSAKLTTSTPAEVVAAAAVCKSIVSLRDGVCFNLLHAHVFPNMTRSKFPFCSCLGDKVTDEAVKAAMEEMDRVGDPKGAASASARELALLWPNHDAAVTAMRKKAEEEAEAKRKKMEEEKVRERLLQEKKAAEEAARVAAAAAAVARNADAADKSDKRERHDKHDKRDKRDREHHHRSGGDHRSSDKRDHHHHSSSGGGDHHSRRDKDRSDRDKRPKSSGSHHDGGTHHSSRSEHKSSGDGDRESGKRRHRDDEDKRG